MHNHKRIKLLSESEINAIYGFPTFNKVEQSLYFEFNNQEMETAGKYRTIKAKTYFLLSLGYFKAQQQFYAFDLKESRDAQYVAAKYFNNNVNLNGRLDKRTYKKQKNDILELLGYKNWSPDIESYIEQQLCSLLKCYPKTHSSLRQLICCFERQKIIIPTYRKLQDIFTSAFGVEEKRLKQILLSIPEPIQKNLSDLINRDENGITQLNIIRADQKNFQYTAIKDEVEKARSIFELYEFSKNFIPTLCLSGNAVNYYADIAAQYATSRLRRLSKTQQWLHMLFVLFNIVISKLWIIL